MSSLGAALVAVVFILSDLPALLSGVLTVYFLLDQVDFVAGPQVIKVVRDNGTRRVLAAVLVFGAVH